MFVLRETFNLFFLRRQSNKPTASLLIFLAVCLFGLPAQAQYGGGNGEPNDPYLIYTAEQMNAIGADANDWDKHFKLIADIDLAQYNGEQFNIIGYDRGVRNNKPFKGVFDGDNHSISNFTYSSSRGDCIGIFGYVFKGELRNVILIDPNVVIGWGDFAGSLAGYVGAGKIMNCHIEGGSVSSRENVGGLVGRAFLGETSACSSTADVSGYMIVGGLVGESRGMITNCNTSGNISGTHSVGGLIGKSYEFDVVTACWSHSNVSGESAVGGLVGWNMQGSLQRCYSSGHVTGTSGCGGLVGSNGGKVFWCYTECSVTGVDSVGGLVAGNDGKIFSCYSTSIVVGETDVGGLIGRSNYGWVQSCFWDSQASGVSVSAGGVACSTTQMKTASTFRGWHSDGYWTLNEGMDYPRLAWETRAGVPLPPNPSGLYRGSGEPNDPYQIRTPEEFVAIAYQRENWGKHFILMRDLEMSGIDPNEIMLIGDDVTPFSGVFDGAGHTISNYTCSLEGFPYVGLFGILVAPTPDPNGVIAVVKNLHLVNAEIRGGDYVGGMVGWNRGTVTGCSVDGNVVGISQVGGLVGVNTGEINTCCTTGMVSSQQDWAGGLVGRNSPIVANIIGPLLSGNGWAGISRSFSSAYVTGERDVGGLVGSHNGKIADCYSSGIVTGHDVVGGLVGDSRGRINFCYSTAYVTGDTNVGGLVGTKPYYMNVFAFCIWDTDMSGINISAVGKGKTTEQMMSSETYYCWGVDGNWTLDEGNDYPHLTWENRGGRPISEYDRRYGGGNGDANEPYQIWTPEQFITVGWYEEDFDKHFLLMTDLDFNDVSSTEIRSIGNAEAPFTGVFDGQGQTVSRIRLSLSSRHVGVFGVVGIRVPDGRMKGPNPYRTSGIDAPGFIMNLQVTDAYLRGNDMQGVLAGFNVNGTISGCSVTGSVGDGWSGRNGVLGGLIGRNMGFVEKCYASCYVRGDYFVGGLIGSNYGIIQSSNSTSEVNGSDTHIGGLAGDNLGNISDCYSQCIVQGSTDVGGLVGTNSGNIINCSSIGEVTGNMCLAGLVGSNKGSVTNSYSTGSVSGNEEVGGLIGANGYLIWSEPNPGTVSYCYSIGSVSGITSVGGLVGHHVAGSITSCFWDTQASRQIASVGGTGKTTIEMQMVGTFLEAGWDFVDETANGTEDIWWILEGQDYPRLWWEALE